MNDFRTFDATEQKILTEELNKLQIDWLNYLADNDDDEAARYRLFVVSWLKNAITAGYLDKLPITFDETICAVDVAE